MPRLNRVLEEMGIKYVNHTVPSRVLKSVKEKEEKDKAQEAEAAAGVPRAPGRKRRGGSGAAPPSRKRRTRSTTASAATPEETGATEGTDADGGHGASGSPSSSKAVSTTATSRDAEDCETEVATSPAATAAVEELPSVVPSVAPLLSLFGADSSESQPSVHVDTEVDGQRGEASTNHHSAAPVEPAGDVGLNLPAPPMAAAAAPLPPDIGMSADLQMGASILHKSCRLMLLVLLRSL